VITFDPDALAARLAELEKEMGEPGFWDDQERAARISTEHARVSRRLERYRRLSQEYEDAAELLAMDGEMAAEIESSIEPLRRELEQLQEDALFSGEYDSGDAVVTIQADAGGTDAQDFAEMVLRMYLRWAEKRGFKTELLEASPGEEAGLKSATFTVEGENAYGVLKAERGKHRLVRLSPFDQAHRRHTSFALVEVIPEIEDEADIEIRPDDLKVDVYRSSGAGGQHVNKTSSAVRMTHLPTGIIVTCQNERSQIKNRDMALKVLRSRLVALREQQRSEQRQELKGEHQSNEWGSQIRSYVVHPYTLVKDHRTGYESGNIQAVLDGDLDAFMEAFLRWDAGREGKAA
jgi:peptide chain release factor 2